ncbi:hypothetical protein GF323_03900 [Candidatus Woesearchaeota archaeon]|nr:hypothetical protein [Candidatus Woesearchaeota archaeon]
MIFDKVNSRRPNLFENILLFLGIVAAGVGYYFVHSVILEYGPFSYQSTVSLLLWILILIVIILTAVGENAKEELKILIQEHHTEIRLLRRDLRRRK